MPVETPTEKIMETDPEAKAIMSNKGALNTPMVVPPW